MRDEEDIRTPEPGEPVAAPEPETGSAEEPEPEAAVPPPPPPPARPAARRLERSQDDRVIAGVCGGLGEYLGVDAVLIRIAALILVFAGGAGIVLYLIGWLAMPEAATPPTHGEVAPEPAAGASAEQRSGGFVLGLVFIVLGVFFLVDQAWPDFPSWKYIWPLALIAVGAAILLRPRR